MGNYLELSLKSINLMGMINKDQARKQGCEFEKQLNIIRRSIEKMAHF